MVCTHFYKKICAAVGKRYYSNRNVMALKERGMLQDIFPNATAQEVTDLCNAAPQCVYAGFDPTAKSLHVGNLLILSNLIHWQRGGHKVIALVGGATGKIGDPSGRTKERDKLRESIVSENVESLTRGIQRIFDNHKKYFWKDNQELQPVQIVNNASWYEELNVVDFISRIGRHMRMGTMLSRSSVESRLASEIGMSFTEFTYQVFQAYDWLHLLKEYNCRFQVGGNDQMGNIMSGQELISRILDKKVYGLTVPLITSESGDKYGKSVNNAVWLEPSMTSPFDLYQFFIRSADSDVSKFLKFFTFMTLGEISDLVAKHMAKPEERRAQKVLAEAVTLLVHGEEGLAEAKRATSALYDSDLVSLSAMSEEEIQRVFSGACQVQMLLEPGITLMDMAVSAKCFLSPADAERIMKAGGFYVNHRRSKNPNEVLVPGVHVLNNNLSLVRVGKRNYWIIKWLK